MVAAIICCCTSGGSGYCDEDDNNDDDTEDEEDDDDDDNCTKAFSMFVVDGKGNKRHTITRDVLKSQNNWEICGDPRSEGPLLWHSPMLLLPNILLPRHPDVCVVVVVILVVVPLQILPPQGPRLFHAIIMLLAFYFQGAYTETIHRRIVLM